MTLRDEFGIVTRNAERREAYAGFIAPRADQLPTQTMATRKPPSNHPKVQKVNPFLVRSASLYLRGYLEGTTLRQTQPLQTAPVRTIIEALITYVGEPEAIVLGPRRARPISWPRQAAMFLARVYCPASLPAIGRAFGNRDHTTAMHAVEQVTERLKGGDKATQHAVDSLIWIAGLDPMRAAGFMARQ